MRSDNEYEGHRKDWLKARKQAESKGKEMKKAWAIIEKKPLI